MSTPLSSAPPTDTFAHRAGLVVKRVGLATATAGLITVAGFASDYAVWAPSREAFSEAVTGGTAAGSVVFGVAVVLLAALHWAAAKELRRAPEQRGLVVSLVAVSIGGVVFFTWVAVLGAQFFAAAGTDDESQFATFALLSFVAYAAPAVGSLAASVVSARNSTGRRPAYAAPLVVLAVVALAVIVLLLAIAL